MCGIIGYKGGDKAIAVVFEGLKTLEYRGYDSWGIASFDGKAIKVQKNVGKIGNFKGFRASKEAKLAIGHTRWATHGRPSDENSHPHKVGPISVIHNGIIENHLALRAELAAQGARFSSETDTEIFAHLVDHALTAGAPDLTTAVSA